MRKPEEILEIIKIFNDRDPNPRCELDYSNAYTLLVAVLLSAQTTDKGVNRATAELFKIADTPQKMLGIGVEKLKTYIKTIGLYNNKAKNVISLSQELVDKYRGEVPFDRSALESLPGLAAKRQTLSSTSGSTSRQSPLIRTSCAFLTALNFLTAKRL